MNACWYSPLRVAMHRALCFALAAGYRVSGGVVRSPEGMRLWVEHPPDKRGKARFCVRTPEGPRSVPAYKFAAAQRHGLAAALDPARVVLPLTRGRHAAFGQGDYMIVSRAQAERIAKTRETRRRCARAGGLAAPPPRNRRLTDGEAEAVRADPRPYRRIAAAYGISRATVYNVKHGLVYRPKEKADVFAA